MAIFPDLQCRGMFEESFYVTSFSGFSGTHNKANMTVCLQQGESV